MDLYESTHTHRELKDKIPPIFVRIATMIFIGGTVLAMLLYETLDGNYDFFNQFLSELGVRNDYIDPTSGNEILSPTYPEIFNVSLILTGIIMLPIFPFLYRQLSNKSRFSNFCFLISVITGSLCGPALIGVGFYDLDLGYPSIYENHHAWAFSLYILITITSLMWALGLLTANQLPYKSKELALKIWIEIVYIVGMIGVMLASLTYHILLYLEEQSIGNEPSDQIGFPIEVLQKVTAFSFFIYYLFVGIKLGDPKYDNT